MAAGRWSEALEELMVAVAMPRWRRKRRLQHQAQPEQCHAYGRKGEMRGRNNGLIGGGSGGTVMKAGRSPMWEGTRWRRLRW